MSGDRVSAFDCEILRGAFHKAVIEECIPEERWREYATQLIREFTGLKAVDSEMLDWIIRADSTQP